MMSFAGSVAPRPWPQIATDDGSATNNTAGVQCYNDPGIEGQIRLFSAVGPSRNATAAQGVVQVRSLYGLLPR